MAEFLTPTALWLVQISAVASCLILLTLVLARITSQPARRQRLCEFGLAAALLATVVSLAPAWLVIGLPLKAQNSPPADSGLAPDELLDLRLDADALIPDHRLAALPPVDMAEPDVQTPLSDSPGFSWSAAVALVLLGLYGGGTLFFLVRWLGGLLVLRRLLRHTEPVPAQVLEMLDIVPGKGPRLLVSRRLRVPISCGVWRPTVVLPIEFCQPRAQARLRWVFAHELTHIERRDALSAVLFALGQAVFFHLPWFWSLRKQVRLCQEYVADAAAVAERPADEYAEFLLTLTETKAPPLLTTGVGGPVSDLFRRVTMLLQNPFRVEKRCPRLWTWGLACLLLALAALLGGVGLRAAAADTIIIIIPGNQTTEPVKEKSADTKKTGQEAPTGYFKIFRLNDKGMILEKPADALLDPTQAIRVRAVRTLGALQVDKDGKKLPPPIKGDQGKLKKVIQELEDIQKIRPDAKELRDLIDGLKAIQGKIVSQKIYQFAYPLDPKKAPLYQPSLGPGPGGTFIKELVPDQGRYEYVFPGTTKKALPGAGGKIDWKKLEKLLEQIQKAPDKVDPKEIRKALEEIRKAAGSDPYWVPIQQLNNPGFYPPAHALITKPGTRGRFGIRFSPPSNDLRDYLGLPKDQGLLIDEVDLGSPAAKAGLKVRDIVLKLNNQPVPSDANKAAKMFAAVKDGTSVDLTILRRGKEDVIKGVKPASTDYASLVRWLTRHETVQARIAVLEKVPEKGALVSILSDRGKFTARHREKQLTITIKGVLKDGKAANLEVLVQVEGKEAFKGAPAAVPEAWRPRVNRLLDLIRSWQSSPQSRAPLD